MKLVTSEIPNSEIPVTLISDVRKLKAYFPYRICWGGFKPDNHNDTLTGADLTKRRYNKALRDGYTCFII